MNGDNILSKDHFNAHNQVVSDYTLLLLLEQELENCNTTEQDRIVKRLKGEMILLLQRIIVTKSFLQQKTEADKEYLSSLLN